MEIAVFEVSEIFVAGGGRGAVDCEVFAVTVEESVFEFAFEYEIVEIPDLGAARELVFFEFCLEFYFGLLHFAGHWAREGVVCPEAAEFGLYHAIWYG